jgi:hypothetical protein
VTTAGVIKRLFEQFDAMLRQAGYIAMSGQIVDASLVAAPRQRNTSSWSFVGRPRRKPLARYSAIEGALRLRLVAQRRSSLKLMVSFDRSRGLPAPSIIEGRP